MIALSMLAITGDYSWYGIYLGLPVIWLECPQLRTLTNGRGMYAHIRQCTGIDTYLGGLFLFTERSVINTVLRRIGFMPHLVAFLLVESRWIHSTLTLQTTVVLTLWHSCHGYIHAQWYTLSRDHMYTHRRGG